MIRIILNHGNWPPWWLNYSEDVHWFSSSTVRNLTSDSPRSKQPQFGFCCSNDSNWSRWMFSVGCDGPSWAPRFGASPSPHLGSISLEHPEILIALIHPENLGVETKGNSVTCFFCLPMCQPSDSIFAPWATFLFGRCWNPRRFHKSNAAQNFHPFPRGMSILFFEVWSHESRSVPNCFGG